MYIITIISYYVPHYNECTLVTGTGDSDRSKIVTRGGMLVPSFFFHCIAADNPRWTLLVIGQRAQQQVEVLYSLQYGIRIDFGSYVYRIDY